MLEQTSTKRQGIVIVPAREAENQPMRGQKNTVSWKPTEECFKRMINGGKCCRQGQSAMDLARQRSLEITDRCS